MRGRGAVLDAVTSMALLLLLSRPVMAQEQALGHKILGTAGLNAGTQPEPGLYAVERVVLYAASELVDRNGTHLPVALDIDAFASAVGASLTLHVPRLHTFLNASFGVPGAYATVNTQHPAASLDRYGLGDIYVQPMKLGWRVPHVDIVTGYAFYAPTGESEPGGNDGVGRGHWTHEFSLGGTVFFDRSREWQLSALGSYELNQRKRDVDVTRGDTIQVQGGVGGRFFRIVDIGVTGYALWQVRDDRGSALPSSLRGARDQAFGMGAEVSVPIPPIRSRFTARYAHDLFVRSRPLGQIALFGITIGAWMF